MKRFLRSLSAAAVLAVAVLAGGCSDDDDDNGGSTGVNTTREYIQIERLGNPLTSEVFLAKRTHGAHNATTPDLDLSYYRLELEGFVNQFGRPAFVATTLSSVLLPDMLIVDTSKGTGSAGWLSWALTAGGAYSGRKLTDDVVDLGLGAIFGDLISDQGTIPSLTSDNVDANDKSFGGSFPYLASPHTP